MVHSILSFFETHMWVVDVLAFVILFVCLYRAFGPKFDYFEGKLLTPETNAGGMLIFYNNRTCRLRKNRRTLKWKYHDPFWNKWFDVPDTQIERIEKCIEEQREISIELA